MPESRPRESSVQSVDRAISILELLAAHGPAGVTEISTELRIHKSTAFRLITTLEARGLLEQDIERGKYRVGYTATQIAAGGNTMRDVAELGRFACQELAAAVGETVTIAVRDGDEVVTVYQARGAAAVTAIDWVGKRQPLHATAAGKLFLADMAEDELRQLITAGLPAHTEATLTDPQALRSQLENVRADGYAGTDEEYEVGLAAVAMPIRSMSGEIVGALAISGPAFRVNTRSLSALLAELKPATAKISLRAGSLKRG